MELGISPAKAPCPLYSLSWWKTPLSNSQSDHHPRLYSLPSSSLPHLISPQVLSLLLPKGLLNLYCFLVPSPLKKACGDNKSILLVVQNKNPWVGCPWLISYTSNWKTLSSEYIQKLATCYHLSPTLTTLIQHKPLSYLYLVLHSHCPVSCAPATTPPWMHTLFSC